MTTDTTTLTGWALVKALYAEIDDVLSEAETGCAPEGTPERHALVSRLVAAQTALPRAISDAWAKR